MQRQIIALVVLCVGLFGAVHGGVDCRNKEDGAYGWGCKAFTNCTGGRGREVFCNGNTVFNVEIEACDDPNNVGPPCGLYRDCTELPDGRYADLTLNCTAYYNCHNNAYWGHQPCAPGLVFDNVEEVCKWPWMVPPPCGTNEDDEYDEW